MSAVITFEIPTELHEAMTASRGATALPRLALEALVAEAVREGTISAGYAGQVLGLSFVERERLLNRHGVVYLPNEEEWDEQRRAIESALQ